MDRIRDAVDGTSGRLGDRGRRRLGTLTGHGEAASQGEGLAGDLVGEAPAPAKGLLDRVLGENPGAQVGWSKGSETSSDRVAIAVNGDCRRRHP